MYRMGIGAGLPPPEAQTVFGAYANTANTLNTLRQNQIRNALAQIQLNAAPTLTQQEIDQGAAKTSIMQNQANFAPQLSVLSLQQKQIQNAMSSEKFKELPQNFQAGLAIKNAQLKILKQRLQGMQQPQGMPQPADQGMPQMGAQQPIQSSIPPQMAAQSALPQQGQQGSFVPSVPSMPPDQVAAAIAAARQIKDPRRLMTAYDPNTGMQVQIPKNYMTPGQNPLNLFLPAGPSTRGGMPSALYDPATQESLSVIGQQQRNKVQQQVYAANLARELLPAIKSYGTIGQFQGAGISKYFPQWAGGTTFDDAAKYQMAKNMAVEHIMSATNLRSTDQTISMMNAVLDRQNGESREGYTERMDAFDKKLQSILQERQRTLRLGAMPLDQEQQDKANAFLMDSYNKALAARGKGSDINKDTVMVRNPQGQLGRLPANEVQAAIKGGWSLQ